MKEKLIAIGDDYWIEDDKGERAFRVNGKVARIRDSWVLEDTRAVRWPPDQGTQAERARRHQDRPCGGREATVKKAMLGSATVSTSRSNDGEDLTVKGNFVDHEYEIERDGDQIAEVSKKWLRVRDSYGVEVDDPATSRSCWPSPLPSTPSPTTEHHCPTRPRSPNRGVMPAASSCGDTESGPPAPTGRTAPARSTPQGALMAPNTPNFNTPIPDEDHDAGSGLDPARHAWSSSTGCRRTPPPRSCWST